MSQTVLVEKLTMLKALYELAEKIQKRPEYTIIGKQRYRTENLPKVAETDSKFISAIIYNCNPLYHLTFCTNEKGDRLTGIHIMSDFDLKEIEDYVNKVFDFKSASKRPDQFTVMEDINMLINMKLSVSFEKNGVFNTHKELEQYLETFLKYTELCFEVMKTIDFNSKKTVLRLVKENIEFAKRIKEYVTVVDFDSFKWK